MSTRYQVPYEAAYEKWKSSRERVDLEYLALPAAPFADVVRSEEETRSVIGKQETRLRKVSSVAVHVRRVRARVETEKKKNQKYPETLADLADAKPSLKNKPDAWGTDLRYVVEGDKAIVTSAGPDKTFDTPDDVTIDTQKQLETRAALHELAKKVNVRRTATGNWPANLEEMKKSSGASRLPSLARTPKDGWGNELVYTAPKDDTSVPTLASIGPDGEAGSADDIQITLDADKVRVGIRQDDLFERLADEIARARHHFEERVDPELAGKQNLFDRALVDVLVYRSGDVPSRIW